MIALSRRDEEILEVLAHKVRFLSLAQISRSFWPNKTIVFATRKRLRLLEEAGFVRQFECVVREELVSKEPLQVWNLNEEQPNFAAISWKLKTRWQKQPLKLTPLYLATPSTAKRYAGRAPNPPKVSEATHDLHLSAVFLYFLHSLRDRAKSWVHEDFVKKRHKIKHPDAYVGVGEGRTVIEMGGESYSQKRLEEFHLHCAQLELPYEIW